MEMIEMILKKEVYDKTPLKDRPEFILVKAKVEYDKYKVTYKAYKMKEIYLDHCPYNDIEWWIYFEKEGTRYHSCICEMFCCLNLEMTEYIGLFKNEKDALKEFNKRFEMNIKELEVRNVRYKRFS